MTTSHARGIKQDVLNDSNVADYLQNFPDFFERNSQLLTKLRLPHVRDVAATVSLVERQVEVLRERNQSLERKLKELVDVARANDVLGGPYSPPEPAADSRAYLAGNPSAPLRPRCGRI